MARCHGKLHQVEGQLPGALHRSPAPPPKVRTWVATGPTRGRRGANVSEGARGSFQEPAPPPIPIRLPWGGGILDMDDIQPGWRRP